MITAMKVEIARDLIDYIEATGVLASVVLALAALVYAKKSADAARGSAEAAETTAAAATQEAEQTRELVRIARDQHDRLVYEASRKPVLGTPTLSFQAMLDPGELTLGQIFAMGHQPSVGQPPVLWAVVVRAAFQNAGDKLAEQVLARFAVPDEVRRWRSGPHGEHAQDVDLHADDLTLAARGRESGAHTHSWRIPRLPPDQPPEALHAPSVYAAGRVRSGASSRPRGSRRGQSTVPHQRPAAGAS